MAVYTKVNIGEARAFAERYGLNGAGATLTPIGAGVTNSNYVLTCAGARYVLTLFEEERDYPDLPFYLAVTACAGASGLPCPAPLPTADGAVCGELAGKPAALFPFLQGRAPSRTSPVHTAAVGAALAQFHLACAGGVPGYDGAPKENSWGISRCRETAQAFLPELRRKDGRAADLIESELAFQQQALPQAREIVPAGVIHGDLFPDNTLFERETLTGMLDFYFACHDILLTDIATCLNAWCFEKDDFSFNFTKASRMVRAYDQARPVTAEEAECLPALARFSALRFLISRTDAWMKEEAGAYDGSVVTAHDPREYAVKLRFHRAIDSYRRYIDR